jgi:hypothetical protein
MVDNPMWKICERVAEVQALLDDHLAGGKHTAADVVAKAQAVLSEPALLRAMFDVGYFPPNTRSPRYLRGCNKAEIPTPLKRSCPSKSFATRSIADQ